MKTIAGLMLALVVGGTAAAQQSADFRIEGGVVNAGGRPDAGVTASSAGFRISLDAIGDGAAHLELTGGPFRAGAGFVPGYPPPLEVRALRFLADDQLAWDPDRAAGVYNLYRDPLASLPGLGYGSCHQLGIAGTATSDSDLPPSGGGFFYLVTAVGRLDEEGTKGRRASGAIRAGSSCP